MTTPAELEKEIVRKRRKETAAVSIVAGILAIALGIFCFLLASSSGPVPREETVSYVGAFEGYEPAEARRSGKLSFADGSFYRVELFYEGDSLADALTSLEKGTVLTLTVSGEGDALEIRGENKTYLSYEESAKAFASQKNGMLTVAWLSLGLGIVLFICGIVEKRGRKPAAAEPVPDGESPMLRHADFDTPCRILLEVKKDDGTVILYRRVKGINELVINRQVYAEKKGLIEFAHTLTARVKGHLIEAGLDEHSFSFIRIDGETLAYKERLI